MRFAYQPQPRGLGDAVLCAEGLVRGRLRGGPGRRGDQRAGFGDLMRRMLRVKAETGAATVTGGAAGAAGRDQPLRHHRTRASRDRRTASAFSTWWRSRGRRRRPAPWPSARGTCCPDEFLICCGSCRRGMAARSSSPMPCSFWPAINWPTVSPCAPTRSAGMWGAPWAMARPRSRPGSRTRNMAHSLARLTANLK